MISRTAGENKYSVFSKKAAKSTRGNCPNGEEEYQLYLQAHVIRNNIIILCMQNKKWTDQQLQAAKMLE